MGDGEGGRMDEDVVAAPGGGGEEGDRRWGPLVGMSLAWTPYQVSMARLQ